MKTIKKEDIKYALVEYGANSITSAIFSKYVGEGKEDAINIILGDFQEEYENAPCDEEGETKEQEKYTNLIIADAAEKIEDLKNQPNPHAQALGKLSAKIRKEKYGHDSEYYRQLARKK